MNQVSPKLFKNNWKIIEISYKEAMDIVVEHHYLHRKCPCTHSYGLFNMSTEEIDGVIVYGTPSSSTLRAGICGKEEAKNVMELTRLWIADTVPKNGESFLIGNTLKLVSKEIIVSYAEVNQGHAGVVYQATNWLYTGLSAKRSDWKVEGLDKHSQTLGDKYTAKEIRAKYGDRFKLVPRPRKHRYVYFNCDKRKKKILLAKLRYKLQPYDK